MANEEEIRKHLKYLFHAHNSLNCLVNTGCMIIPLPYSQAYVISVFKEVVNELGLCIVSVGACDDFSDCDASFMLKYEVYLKAIEEKK